MSMDPSLKSASSLTRHRNVLTRGERLEQLTAQKKWDVNAKGVFGLPKVGHRKLIVGGKTPKVAGEADAAAAAPAKGGKAASAAKGAAAPAAKGAAPAAKAAAPAAKKK